MYYEDILNPLFIAHAALLHTQCIVGDIFLVSMFVADVSPSRSFCMKQQVYRCYVLWDRRWQFILFPLLAGLGTTSTQTSSVSSTYSPNFKVGSFGDVVALASAGTNQAEYNNSLVPWLTTFYACTWLVNASCTALILGKMYQIRRRQQEFTGALTSYGTGGAAPNNRGTAFGVRAQSVLAVLVESAVVYLLAMSACMVSYVLKTSGTYIILQTVCAPSLSSLPIAHLIPCHRFHAS